MAEDGYWNLHAPISAHNHFSDFMLVCFDLEKCFNSTGKLDYNRNDFLLSLIDFFLMIFEIGLKVRLRASFGNRELPLLIHLTLVGLSQRSSF